MRTELEIIGDIIYYRSEKLKTVKKQQYDLAYEAREKERNLLKDLFQFLDISLLENDTYGEWNLIEKSIEKYYQNKYGEQFTFPSVELIRQIKLSEILDEK